MKKISHKVILPIIILGFISSVLIYYIFSTRSVDNLINTQVRSSLNSINQFKEVRGYYTKNVIAVVKKTGVIKPHFEHKGVDGVIPLPATFIHELSAKFKEKNNGTTLDLYSSFPFPNRSARKLDQFQKNAIKALNLNPTKPYIKSFLDEKGKESVRVAIADLMVAKACVNCHNTHPDSPKTDWKLNDVRGILEVTTDISSGIIGTKKTNQIFLVVLGSSFIILILILIFVLNRSVVTPISKAANAVKSIADGNLDVKIVETSTDEVGKMSNSINDTLKRIENAFGSKTIQWMDLEAMRKAELAAQKEAKDEKEAAEKARVQADKAMREAKEEKKSANIAREDAEKALKVAEEQKVNAEKAKDEAEKSKKEAKDEKRFADKAKAEVQKSKVEAEKALEVAKNEKANAAEASKNAEDAKRKAEDALKLAESEKENAKKSLGEADEARLKANKALELAEEEKKKAATAKDDAKKAKKDAMEAQAQAQQEKENAEIARKEAVDAKVEAENSNNKIAAMFKESEEEAKQLLEKVNSILNVVNLAAKGDLTQEITVSGEDPIGKVGEGLRSFFENISNNLIQIDTASRKLEKASEQLRTNCKLLENNSEETEAESKAANEISSKVNEGIHTVSTNMNELVESIKEISKRTFEAKSLTEDVSNKSQLANKLVISLGESSSEIGSVIKLISSIAQQTNLLALNATIEAARAGEAGKGFAVVANEVKELAKQTAEASDDITNKIGNIQNDSKQAVKSIEDISSSIEKINDSTGNISASVEEQAATTNEVSTIVGESANLVQEIADNIDNVQKSARVTLDGVEENNKSATELSSLALELNDLVNHFKLGNASANTKVDTTSQQLEESVSSESELKAKDNREVS